MYADFSKLLCQDVQNDRILSLPFNVINLYQGDYATNDIETVSNHSNAHTYVKRRIIE